MTFDQWLQLRLDSLRRQNEWRKIDCLLASKEYVRDAWEVNAVPEGYVVVPVEPTDEQLKEAVKAVLQCTWTEAQDSHDFDSVWLEAKESYSAMISAAPRETK